MKAFFLNASLFLTIFNFISFEGQSYPGWNVFSFDKKSANFSFNKDFCNGEFYSDYFFARDSSIERMDSVSRTKSLPSIQFGLTLINPVGSVLTPEIKFYPQRRGFFLIELFGQWYDFKDSFYRSYGSGVGLSTCKLKHKGIFDFTAGLVTRIHDSRFYPRSIFWYAKLNFYHSFLFSGLRIGLSISYAGFIFDPYFNSIKDDENFSWDDSETANYFYRRMRHLVFPSVTLAWRF